MFKFPFDREETFKLTLDNNTLDIINIEEVIDFSDKEIDIKYNKGICIIHGINLNIKKMLDNEIFIQGTFNKIEL